ncbi:MAG: hydroxymethylbilane synthase [Eubacteriaceae bacterium]|nr:hydroxymethylbilane synthase [Eubacteriaceae bacterium]
METIRVGTRGSELALAQTNEAIERIESAFPGYRCEKVIISTTGDRFTDVSLDKLGSNGLFTNEIEHEMREGKIDIAVHSGKDLPSYTAPPFSIPAVLKRSYPTDCLLYRVSELDIEKNTDLAGLTIGTSSSRREYLAKKYYPSCRVELIRGNIQTRLNKLRDGKYDLIFMAKAAIARSKALAMDGIGVIDLPAEQFVPAACQGIIAIEALETSRFVPVMEKISDNPTKVLFDSERKLMRLLKASCHDETGVNIAFEDGICRIHAFYKESGIITKTCPPDGLDETIELLAKELQE